MTKDILTRGFAMDAIKKPRIVSNPDILGGTPVIERTRVPAGNILAEVKAGSSTFEIFCHYPSLPIGAVEAVIEWEKAGRPL